MPEFQGRTRRPDVLVIGGGLAGATAALAARRTGARVTLVAEGSGVLELSSGCIDRLAVPFADLAPEHPYRLMGEQAVDWELTTFQLEIEQVGWPMTPSPKGGNRQVVTALGARRPTFLTPHGMAAPEDGQPVWVVGFRALRDFHPGVVAAGLGGSAAWSWVDLPGSPDEIHPVALARQLEVPAYLNDCIERIAAARPDGFSGCVFFPAVLGLTGAVRVQQAISAALRLPIGEVLLPPPSVPGLRLSEFLRRAVQQAGIDLAMGARVAGARVEGDRVLSVTAQGPGGETTYEAAAYVLATGGLLGNGLVSEGLEVREPIFGLPVAAPESGEPADWAAAEFLPSGGHPFVRIGVTVDETLRPPGLANLFVCGRTLAGYDPYSEGCGGGVAVATGGLAGRRAGRMAVGNGGERR